MDNDIVVALISGICVAVPAIVTVVVSNKQNKNLIQYQIQELTREVREHNNFARRVPVLEEQIKVANHRIEDLERGN